MAFAEAAPYIAFKSLIPFKDGALGASKSSEIWMPSDTPLGPLPVAFAKEGISAGGMDDALFQEGHIYAVAPLFGGWMTMTADGWRAERAVALRRVVSEADAARIVLESFSLGYPQVEGILSWASYTAAMSWEIDLMDDIILAAMSLKKASPGAKEKVAKALLHIGKRWPDDLASPIVAKALIHLEMEIFLFWAGCEWKRAWFHPVIAQALKASEASQLIERARESWPLGRALLLGQ